MKKIALLFASLMLISLSTVHAQRSSVRNQSNEINIGVRPFHLGATSIQYKTKISHNNWLRLGITDIGFNDDQIGFRAGLERQRNLLGRARLIYGLEPGVFIEQNNSGIPNDYTVDLGFPVGVQLHLSKRIILGFEARPNIEVYKDHYDELNQNRNTKLGGGIDLFNGIRTTIGYRF